MPHGDETTLCVPCTRGEAEAWRVAWGRFLFAPFFFSEGLFSACIAEGVWIGAETSSSSLFVPAAYGHAS